jgi:GxxExxY protein
MPIQVSRRIEVFDQERFHAVDRKVMRVVFDVHNEFGRLLDEVLYKNEIAARCAGVGLLPVEREVRICVSHQTFTKVYAMDVLLCNGLMLEAKVAEQLAAAHRNQALHYLLLTGMNHGRLVNFRASRVDHEFVSTRLTPEARRRITVVDREWLELNAESGTAKASMLAMLQDWGAFLDVNLYREALIHLLGGAAMVTAPVEIFSGPRVVGTQSLNLLNKSTAVAVTSAVQGVEGLREHMQRLLNHTRLEAIQWINLNRHLVEFRTLHKGSG